MNNALGNKEIMSKNIQYYMNVHRKSRQDMCDALGVKYTTFTDWIKGKTYPRIDKIELMANYFGISKSDLVEDRSKRTTISAIRIPTLGKVAAGVPIDRIEDVIGQELIPANLAETGEYFALKIQGDSMYPRIYDGDTVIVRSQCTAENGDIVIVSVNGDDATCKIFTQTPSGVMLRPLNGSYEPIFLTEENGADCCIIGKVVEIRARV